MLSYPMDTITIFSKLALLKKFKLVIATKNMIVI